VPEISLTPQLIHRFSKRFGDKIAVIHSHLTEREKTDQWWSIVDDQKQILIGARSALFCPLERLGLIIVDEEHEPSFKQDEKLKYHGRDAAIMLAKLSKCPIILGSATPSLETWQNALAGRYKLHRLRQRVKERPLPEVRLIDLKDAPKCPDTHWLSVALKLEIDKTLERGKQVALFLNRRGTAPVVICQSCGKVCECPNCDMSLTLHRNTDLICHYCNYHENYTTLCKQCGDRKVLPSGLGTEQVETDLKRMYPGITVTRADRDEIQNRADLEELLTNMESGKIQILVGTQMIAKGLDFPLLETVGFVFADVGFALPDFRSTERSFQLVTQMSGRAGRHASLPEERGRVLIQTLNPTHPALQFVSDEAYPEFAEAELRSREELGFPPYGRLAQLRISAITLRECSEGAEVIRTRLKALREKSAYQGIEILGPAPAPIEKLRGRFRYQALIKGPDSRLLHQYLAQFMKPLDWLPKRLKLSVDIDPLNLL
jgi:primosomal protein N' (replication factor Y)